MVTQHPDHAGAPFWSDHPLISASQETREAYISFAELGATEYKWDWEGKFVDEAVVERLLSEHFDYFQKTQLGRDKFLTFRLPNPKVETEFRLGRAFMGMLTASSLARHMGYDHDPLFEVILPMTESAEEMIGIQESFAEMASLKHPLLKYNDSTLKHIELIPLIEQIQAIAKSSEILETYIDLHKKTFGKTPVYLRPYLARSDPSLNSGVIPTILSIKVALSRFLAFEEKHGIDLYPVLGAAALPFRGGLTPLSIEQFADEYAGMRTTTIQSAFRYDYSKSTVIKGIKLLEKLLAKGKAQRIPEKERTVLFAVMNELEPLYQEVIEDIAGDINTVAKFIPKRRERVQHVGLFGYSRGVGSVKLPRAIGFTCAMYSLGVPPEFIGVGRGMSMSKNRGWNELIEKYYKYMKSDFTRAGGYLNKKNLEKLAKYSVGWNMVLEDVDKLEKYLGVTFGPKTNEEKEHELLTSKIYASINNKRKPGEYIEAAALLRKSMG